MSVYESFIRTSIIFRLVVITATLVFADTVHAQNSENEIIWLRAHFPPASILKGPAAGTGTVDRMQILLERELPTITHIKMDGNYKRILHELKSRKPACATAILKTPEREKFVYYSVPFIVIYPNGLVIEKVMIDKVRKFIDAEGRVDLGKLILQGNLKIGYSSGRAYGQAIDNAVNQHKGSPNLEPLYHTLFLGILKMIEGKRDVQGAFGFAREIGYFKKIGQLKEDFIWLPIAGMPSHLLGHMGCAKTPWGAKMIQQINKILIENRATDQALSFYSDYLDRTMRNDYHVQARAVFKAMATD